jgi:RNA recognition motif-containing protein
METKLFVGNFTYDTSEEDLRALFSQAGTVVSVTVIKDRDTGRSRGYGFIEMSSQSEAEQAIKMFNGYTLSDRSLKVDKARPREERPSTGGFDRRPNREGWRDRNRRSGGRTRR